MHVNKKTHTNPLSKQEVEELRKNPNVKKVSTNTVMFTEDFKKYVYEKKSKGITLAEIFREAGIDPVILGESRIQGFSYLLNKRARIEGKVADQRENNNHGQPKAAGETLEQRLTRLEKELAYTKQALEFLENLEKSNVQAQRQWESILQLK